MNTPPFALTQWTAWMQLALQQARLAADAGEVPVGCVIAGPQGVLASSHNLVETSHDPTAHAEILAIRQACLALHSTRLEECIALVTLEPCAMCACALAHARIAGLIYAAPDPKAGACRSLISLPNDARFPRTYPFVEGLLQAESTALLQQFFQAIRTHDPH